MTGSDVPGGPGDAPAPAEPAGTAGVAGPAGAAGPAAAAGVGDVDGAPPRPRVGAADVAAALDLPTPTPEQTRVIEAPPASMLVVAGAGSGKTETMSARVVWLVANGLLEPEEVLGLTFTRKAAGELAERIGRRLARLAEAGLWRPADPDAAGGGAGARPSVSTYHAYAGRLVSEHGLRLGVEPDARLLSEAASWQLAHEIVGRYDGPMDGVEAAASTVTAAVLALSGEMAEHLVDIEQVDELLETLIGRIEGLPPGGRRTGGLPRETKALLASARARRRVLPIVDAYRRAKAQRDYLDFADQMALAARLAEMSPAVRAAERRRFSAVLLDEFQDTSEAQMRLLHALFAAPAEGGEGDPVPVTAVGDPHQSIYGWRGASATTLARFPRRFSAGGIATETLPLSTSWRNDTGVLAVANTTAAPLTAATPVPVSRLRARPDAGRGAVSASRHETQEEEAGAVADWIAGHWWSDPDARVRSGLRAAVLCRRRAQFPALVDALGERGLPVEVVGLGGLLATPEVSDLLALLGVVDDPARGDLLMRLLTGPRLRLGPADLDALGAWSRTLRRRRAEAAARPGERPAAETGASRPDPLEEVHDAPSIVEALDEPPPVGWHGPNGERLGDVARERLGALRRIVTDLRTLTAAGPADLVTAAERALGLDVELLARPDVHPEVARVHLDAFVDVAASFTAAADRATLGGFLDWLEAARTQERGLEAPAANTSEGAVQILTVHAAKGLEWDVVAVPGLIEGAFPSYRSGASSPRDGVWRLAPPRDKAWTSGLDALPHDLRGDTAGLPTLRWRDAADLEEFEAELVDFAGRAGEHGLEEERRLAYVAFTRARRALHLSASVWTDAATPRVTSRFLVELIEAEGPVRVGEWAPMPDPDAPAANPRDALARTAVWPPDADAVRVDVVADAAAAVEAASARLGDGGDAASAGPVAAGEAAPRHPDPEIELLDRELDALVAEHERRSAGDDDAVKLPGHLSTSDVVALAQDPAGFATRRRRPMPRPPATAARRGTRFHEWIESHYGQAAMVDLDEIPGRGDVEAPDADLETLRRLFLASEWAERVPLAVEVPLETVVAGVPIRGRIDAVFPRGDGGVVIVDWKSGALPGGRALRARALQLAVYRLAYRRLHGLDAAAVDAAFYVAATGETLWPDLPGDDDLLAELAGLLDGGRDEGG